MKNGKLLLLLVFSVVSASVPVIAQSVTVQSAGDLLLAVSPGKKVILTDGEFLLSDVQSIKSNYVKMIEAYDGNEVLIKGVDNLTLQGSAGSYIETDPRYAFVLRFEDCQHIRIENLKIGHTNAGYCIGGVLQFTNCTDVVVSDCQLYGSGTIGVEMTGSKNVAILSSDISDCTSGAVYAYESSGVSIQDSNILYNEAYPLLLFESCSAVSISACDISGNTGSMVFSIDGDPGEINLSGCGIEENSIEAFSEDGVFPVVSENTYSGNSFETPLAENEGRWEYYSDTLSGLVFSYPAAWNFYKHDDGISMTDPSGKKVMMALIELKPDIEESGWKGDSGKLIQASFEYLTIQMKKAEITLDTRKKSGVYEIDVDLPAQDFEGRATYVPNGEENAFLLTVIPMEERVFGFLTFITDDGIDIFRDTVGDIIASVGWGPPPEYGE